jgi:hypothetical protein
MSGFCHICYFLDGTKHESTTMVDVGEYNFGLSLSKLLSN